MQKGFIKKHLPKTLETRVSCKTGIGPGGKGKMGIGLHIRMYMRLDGYRARQSLVGLSAHCANSYIP